MTDNHTLLSFIALRHTIGREDVATDALFFILSHSEAARQALSCFLGDECGPLPITKAKPRMTDEHGATPDLACLDSDDNVVALVESKFWATLTHNQPVTYWQGLPKDKPAVLMFLAPAFRVNESGLWDELVARLSNAGHELGPATRAKNLIFAPSKDSLRRLVLTSWTALLGQMAQDTERAGDDLASFEIAQLKGLATSVIRGDNPRRDDNLKKLIEDAVKRLEQSGWANLRRLSSGRGFDYYARYLYLAGCYAWLGIDYKALKEMPDKPLWLSFYKDNAAKVDLKAIRARLDETGRPSFVRRNNEMSVSIPLPVNADTEATLEAIVVELERIARTLDPNGPTYRR